ncbi:MAG: HAD family hydrolase [Ornithinimicrobium sp.]
MEPIDAVLFDFHQTLERAPQPRPWLTSAREQLGRPADADADHRHGAFLANLWVHAHEIDPTARRDLSARAHREVATKTMIDIGGMDAELAGTLYDGLLAQWYLFEDVPDVLRELHTQGTHLAVVSNIGLDIRPLLADEEVLDYFEAIVLSFEIGAVKPDPAIFEYAVKALGVSPSRTLMVGDSWRDDAGAAQLGIRTLILPPTSGPRRGLDAVLRLTAP